MKISKNISKLIGLSLIMSNFSLYPSIATFNNEIPNRYETFEGEYITINDSMEGEINKIEILGNTIQNEDDLSDIKSVGDKVDEKELYEIPIVTTGKNLFDMNSTNVNYSSKDGVTSSKHYIENDYLIVESIIEHTWTNVSFNNIKVKPNTTYTFTPNAEVVKGDICVWAYDNNRTKLFEIPNISKTFTTDSATNSITLVFYSQTKTNYTDSKIKYKPQLEEGNASTKYEPYKEEKLTVLSPTPLEKVGDISDRIVCKNGVWGVEKKIGTEFLSGNNWSIGDFSTENDYWYIHTSKYDNLIKDKTTGISNVYPSIEYIGTNSMPTKESVSIGATDTGNHVRFTILKSNLSNIEQWNDYLNNNNIYIKYITKENQFIPLPYSQQIKLNTFLDKTHIFSQTENGVNATLKVTVDRLNKMALDATTEAENNPTIDNLNTARNLVNHMDESNLKEQLQQRLNNISALNDLQLERKTSTSNVDIYIKSENMLSMSLLTNNITFEDYSGVDDLEQNSAIKISINSSLPYQLNSYLISEMQNTDGSKIIDKDRLNIKDSSDIDYKEFITINDKLVLKDNCNAGNDLSHYIDLKLNGGEAYTADIYKTIIKFEAEQK